MSRVVIRTGLCLFLIMSGLAPSMAQTLEDFAREAGIPILSVRILAEVPHDTACWTQGLAYENGILYESVGEYGKSKILKLDAKTGELLQYATLDDRYFGEGLAIFGEELIVLTWLENTAFVFDGNSLSPLRTMNYSTEGWGLATADETLVMSDGSNRLVFRSPEDFSEAGAVTVTFGKRYLHNLNELEYANDHLYANILGTDHIARIHPGNGEVTGLVDGRELRNRVGGDRVAKPMNGIAYDPESGDFFLTGKKWPTIFRARITEQP
ncbi:glutaminyl-peptide cyclotransferase [bacterium]|nr:glutaminyl-peptide cyclotransferase [bacterium]MBU1984453.1 glutaminyl-peptide cyclotransferase [bacterium]